MGLSCQLHPQRLPQFTQNGAAAAEARIAAIKDDHRARVTRVALPRIRSRPPMPDELHVFDVAAANSQAEALRVETRAPMLSSKRHFAGAVGASYANFVASVAASLVVTPIVLRVLGSEQYGLWLVVSSWIAYLSLTGAGFPQATQNRVAEAYATGRNESVGASLAAAMWSTACLATIAFVIVGVVVYTGGVSAVFASASVQTQRAVAPVLLVVAAAYLGALPAEQFRAVLRATHRVALAQVISAAGIVGSAAIGVAVVLVRPTVVSFAISQAVAISGVAAASVFATTWVLRHAGIRLDLRRVSLTDVRALLSPSLHFLAIALAGALIWSTDNVIVAWRLGPGEVAPYAISFRVTTMASSAVGAVALTLLPSVTTLWATQQLDRLRGLTRRIARVTLALAALASVELLLVGRAFIRGWAGPDALVSPSVFAVFVSIFAVRAVAQAMELIVVGLSQHRTYAAIVMTEGGLNLVLSLVLVQHLGGLGVALGTLISHLLCTGWYLPWSAMRKLNLRPTVFVGPSVVAVVSAFLGWLAGRGVAMLVGLSSWPAIIAVAAATGVGFSVAYGLITIIRAEPRDRLDEFADSA